MEVEAARELPSAGQKPWLQSKALKGLVSFRMSAAELIPGQGAVYKCTASVSTSHIRELATHGVRA